MDHFIIPDMSTRLEDKNWFFFTLPTTYKKLILDNFIQYIKDIIITNVVLIPKKKNNIHKGKWQSRKSYYSDIIVEKHFIENMLKNTLNTDNVLIFRMWGGERGEWICRMYCVWMGGNKAYILKEGVQMPFYPQTVHHN